MTQLKDGAIVSWASPADPVKLSDLRLALVRAGLSEDLARDMAARNAFSRAARELSKERIIKRVEETDDEIRFQFTKEFLSGSELNYEKEFDVLLNKDSGVVRCDDNHMQQTAQQLVDNHKATRMPGDITRLVQKIFESKGGDLVPIRQQGGCYFVPPTHTEIITNAGNLLDYIGGKISVWEISANSPATQVAVQENMYSYLLGLVDEFNQSCESITSDTSTKVIERRVDRINELRAKLMAHAPLLMGLAEEVSAAISNSEISLIQAASGQASDDVSVDADTSAELVA